MTDSSHPTNREPSTPDAVLLVAKSAFAAAPHQDMWRLAMQAEGLCGARTVRIAFTEQGTPSLREALFNLIDEDVGHILIIPLMLPLEPSFQLDDEDTETMAGRRRQAVAIPFRRSKPHSEQPDGAPA